MVLGAGTAGLVSAIGAAGLGAKVALVERHLMGGDCLHVSCVPSKGVIRAARAVPAVREGSALGVRAAQRLTLGHVARTIHPYPTQAEAWKRLGDAWNRRRLTPRARRLFERFLALWR